MQIRRDLKKLDWYAQFSFKHVKDSKLQKHPMYSKWLNCQYVPLIINEINRYWSLLHYPQLFYYIFDKFSIITSMNCIVGAIWVIRWTEVTRGPFVDLCKQTGLASGCTGLRNSQRLISGHNSRQEMAHTGLFSAIGRRNQGIWPNCWILVC